MTGDAARELRERELREGAEIPPPAPAPTPAGPVPEGPEKVQIPAEMVGDLIMCAIRSQEGNAVWRGFVAAHGHPEWLTKGEWRLAVAGAEVVRSAPPQANGRS